MRDAPENLYGLERAGLEALVADLGLPRFHGRQIYRWMYARDVLAPDRWTDLPKPARADLGASFRVETVAVHAAARATDGTVKYRVTTVDGASAEAVYMRAGERVTLCISSQVGCALDCGFCLTGRMGLSRHLTPGEIVGQVAGLVRERAIDDTSFNLVFMGMGEPLHNYDQVMAAIRILCDPEGFGMSRRRITLSTVGLAPAIERLAREPVRPRLAVSLNATTDAERDRLMPVNRRYPLAVLEDALASYARETGDRFTFEYVLLAGVNDSDEDVGRLAAMARRHGAKINLIPFNAVPQHLPFASPSRERVLVIRDALLGRGAPTSVRWSRGIDARAACGQLAVLPGDVGAAEVSDG